MGRETKIEWTDHTFNPWRGCQKVSEGCKFCYAEILAKRNPAVLGEWGPGKRAIAAEPYWEQPRKWNAAAAADGQRRKVFCLSLGDVWEKHDDLIGPRTRLFQLILDTPDLDWLLLTKRPFEAWHALNHPGRFGLFFDLGKIRILDVVQILRPQVWMGVSVENQSNADERIPLLLAIPACRRFVSCEPLLGAVRLDDVHGHSIGTITDSKRINALIPQVVFSPGLGDVSKIDWVIVGGESGPKARPMHPRWALSLLSQCHSHAVPFFFKQWGEWSPTEDRVFGAEGIHLQAVPGETKYAVNLYRVGKNIAGRELNRSIYSEVPAASPVPIAEKGA